MPDAFVGLGNFAPLFAPPEILECYLPSFDGELAPSSIGWGDAFADWLRWRGHRGNRIAAQTGSSTHSLAERAYLPILCSSRQADIGQKRTFDVMPRIVDNRGQNDCPRLGRPCCWLASGSLPPDPRTDVSLLCDGSYEYLPPTRYTS